MLISDIAIRRPVFTTMVTAGLMVLGGVAFTRLGVDLFPDISFPVVTIVTPYPGAGPSEVESLLTRPIEDAIGSVNHVDEIRSFSREGSSTIVVMFKLEADIKQAVNDVRDRVAGVRGTLPRDIRDPVITRVDPQAQPVLIYALDTDLGPLRNRALVEDVVKPVLERIGGVGAVNIRGGQEREIQVLLDASKLEALGLSPTAVSQAVAAEGWDVPGGRMTGTDREISIRSAGRFASLSDLGEVVLVSKDGMQVRIKDVAEIRDGIKEVRTSTRVNGRNAVAFEVIKQSGSNTIAVCDLVYKALDGLKPRLPEGARLTKLMDGSTFIRGNVADVEESIFFGGAMAILIIFLFMLDWRSTFISALALPTSIITTFFAMQLMGFTLNMMSLMGLSLAIGLLIDDAVVVRENIYRHMERGEDPVTAARRGTAEIGLAVMATTFTVVAVFVPVAFMQGIVGKIFQEFALTVAAAVMVSLFISFTLDPMLSARLVKRIEKHGDAARHHPILGLINRAYDGVDRSYRGLLEWVFSGWWPKTVVLGISLAGFLVSLYVAGRYTGKEFMPQTDRSEFSVNLELPPGTTLARTDEAARQVEEMLREDKLVTVVFTTLGPNEEVHKASLRVQTVPKDQRTDKLDDIVDRMRRKLANLPDIKVVVSVGSTDGQGENPLRLVVRGPDLKVLAKLADQALDIARSTPGAVDVNSSYVEGKPELRLAFDRRALGDLGLNVMSVAAGVRTAVEGDTPARFRDGEKDYDIRVRLRAEDRSDKELLSRLVFPSRKGKLVYLNEVARLEPSTGPTTIERVDRGRMINIAGNLQGRPLGAVVGDIKAQLAKISLPEGYSFDWKGQTKSMQDSMQNLMLALAMAIIFIYLVLASQFESFVHPFTIMLSLPLAMVGALLALFMFDMSLGVFSMIGIILLMGLVTKNAILLVDNANQHQVEGKSPVEALLIAGPTRLRPILMTSAAMVLGMLPPAMSRGQGSEMRAPMAIAVIAGVITSTFLTLVVVPIAYTWFDRLRKKDRLVVKDDDTAVDGQPVDVRKVA